MAQRGIWLAAGAAAVAGAMLVPPGGVATPEPAVIVQPAPQTTTQVPRVPRDPGSPPATPDPAPQQRTRLTALELLAAPPVPVVVDDGPRDDSGGRGPGGNGNGGGRQPGSNPSDDGDNDNSGGDNGGSSGGGGSGRPGSTPSGSNDSLTTSEQTQVTTFVTTSITSCVRTTVEQKVSALKAGYETAAKGVAEAKSAWRSAASQARSTRAKLLSTWPRNPSLAAQYAREVALAAQSLQRWRELARELSVLRAEWFRAAVAARSQAVTSCVSDAKESGYALARRLAGGKLTGTDLSAATAAVTAGVNAYRVNGSGSVWRHHR